MFCVDCGPPSVRLVRPAVSRRLVRALARLISLAPTRLISLAPTRLISLAPTRRALLAAMLGPMLAIAGCSSHQTPYAAANSAVVRPNPQVAAVVIEDDGLPSQSPPPMRIRSLPDDPSEPFSRNYGGANPTAGSEPIDPDVPGAAPATLHHPSTSAGGTDDADMPPALPHDLPPAFRQKLVAAMAAHN